MNSATAYPTFAQLIVRSLTGPRDRLVMTEVDGHAYTLAEASDLVARMGTVLVDDRGARGKGVGLLAHNRADAWMALLGSMVRGAYVGALPNRAALDDLVAMCAEAELDSLVVDAAHAGLGQAIADAGAVRQVYCLNGGEVGVNLLSLVERAPSRRLATVVDSPDELCRLVYTGGSTGRPKAITYTHGVEAESAMRLLWVAEMPAVIRYLVMAPMTHGAWMSMLPALLRGGSVHFVERFQGDLLPDLIQRHRITYLAGVPNHLYDLLDALAKHHVDLSSLQRLLYGGSSITPSRLTQALEVFGPILTGMYGMQETGGGISVLAGADHDPDRPDLLETVGQFVPGVTARLMTAEGREAERGETGEIILRSPTVTSGYWKQPEQTAQTLAGGWFHTGDLATVDDAGFVTIAGRVKDMVVSGGFNVFPAEVENVIAGHPAVAAVSVIGVPHERWGEAVHAVVELKPGAAVTGEELAALVRERKGPIYAPKSVEFVAALARTSSGKVDKAALRASSTAPHRAGPDETATGTAHA